MSKRYEKPMTVDQLAKVKDEDIDFNDMPELDEEFWKNARVVEPDRTVKMTWRVKKSVVDFFKTEGEKGYQTRMNAVLESYVQAHKKHT